MKAAMAWMSIFTTERLLRLAFLDRDAEDLEGFVIWISFWLCGVQTC